MNRMTPAAVVLAVVGVVLGIGVASAGDVNIGINLGAPAPVVVAPQPVVVAPAPVVIAPPPAIMAPPPVVLVPGTQVYSVPSASFNLFMYGGRYFSFHNDHWFVTARYGAPWTMVAVDRVPVAVRRVPSSYYRVPPGHARRMEEHEGYEHERDDRGFCPPGQAKKGRC